MISYEILVLILGELTNFFSYIIQNDHNKPISICPHKSYYADIDYIPYDAHYILMTFIL